MKECFEKRKSAECTSKMEVEVVSVLVQRWRHQAPMYAVLCRYNVGTPDKYGRGLWITMDDVERIETFIRCDPDRIEVHDRVFIWGTNKFNHVELPDFRGLFCGRKGGDPDV